jgi:hypothetical protein
MPRNQMTLTLTNANQNYKLSTLIAAVDATTRKNFREIRLQAQKGNADSILIGDGALSAIDFGEELIAGDSTNHAAQDGLSCVSTEDFFMRSATAGQKVNFRGRE